jgi:magnesium transporter
MARFAINRKESFGKPPGSVVFIGKRRVETVGIQMIAFDYGERFEEIEIPITEGINLPPSDGRLQWFNVIGLHDTDLVRELGEKFDLHDLLLEDVVNTELRPRMEEFDNCLFFSLKMLRFDEEKNMIYSEQVSIVMRENLVITFQEEPGDVFELIRDRIRTKKGKVRKSGADYMTYALLDMIFDHYTSAVEKFGDVIEDLETDLLDNPSKEILNQINQFKREINFLRKHIRPARELAQQYAKMESPLIANATRQYLKELSSNAAHASEVIDSYASMLSDFLHVYHTSMSSKINDVMKVLTIFSAIFIPLTFIAGIYGTNFDYLPELHWKYSYAAFWGVLVTVGLIMLNYFRRKGWF